MAEARIRSVLIEIKVEPTLSGGRMDPGKVAEFVASVEEAVKRYLPMASRSIKTIEERVSEIKEKRS